MEKNDEKRPLYVYRLNRETGEICRYVIKEYLVFRAVAIFSLPDVKNTFRVKISDFDKAKSGKVVSYTDSTEAAVRLFIAYLEEKINKVQSDLNRYKELNAKLHLYIAIGD